MPFLQSECSFEAGGLSLPAEERCRELNVSEWKEAINAFLIWQIYGV